MKNTRLEQLREFLAGQPHDPFLKYAIATEYLKLNDRANALSWFERLLREHPDYLGTYYHIGKLYEELGRIREARESYSGGIRLAREQGNQQTLGELSAALLAISEEED
ncbi:MAG: tetratricopeptide repeat protein [Solitalea sp.]